VCVCVCEVQGKEFHGELTAAGAILDRGKTFLSPSGWSVDCKRQVNPSAWRTRALSQALHHPLHPLHPLHARTQALACPPSPHRHLKFAWLASPSPPPPLRSPSRPAGKMADDGWRSISVVASGRILNEVKQEYYARQAAEEGEGEGAGGGEGRAGSDGDLAAELEAVTAGGRVTRARRATAVKRKFGEVEPDDEGGGSGSEDD
jgi:hypothetical protein